VERHYRAIFALFSLGLLLTFLAFRDLPMVDLPQHASQLYLWRSWPNVVDGDAHFFLNLRTPYLVAYALARLLAPLIGLIAALKFLAWVAVVANALALTVLVNKLGHNHWLGLLGFPTALCHSFYFGFFSFLFASPLAI